MNPILFLCHLEVRSLISWLLAAGQ